MNPGEEPVSANTPDITVDPVGGEHPQYARMEQLHRSRAAQPVASGKMRPGQARRVDTDQLDPPQVFPRRPSVPDDPAVSAPDAIPHLPGRPPPAGWDGEPGPHAPPVTQGGG